MKMFENFTAWAFQAILICVGMLLSTLLNAEEVIPVAQYVDSTYSSRANGFSEAIQITGLVFVVVGLIGSVAGYFGFKWLQKGLVDTIKEEIRLSDCISLVDLGLKYYESYGNPELHNDAKVAALNSSIAVTSHALTIVNGLGEENKRKISLRALIGTNLSYFYADLSRLVTRSEAKANSIDKVYRLLGEVKFEVQVLERVKHVDFEIEWYNVLESRLSAEFRVSNKLEIKVKIVQRIDGLTEDIALPAAWRQEIEEDWLKLRKEIE